MTSPNHADKPTKLSKPNIPDDNSNNSDSGVNVLKSGTELTTHEQVSDSISTGRIVHPHVTFAEENNEHKNDYVKTKTDAGQFLNPRMSTPGPNHNRYDKREPALPYTIDDIPHFDADLSPRRKEKEPMKYNGKSDWTDYLGHFRAVSEWNHWAYPEMGLQLAMCLTEDAREVLGSMPHTIQHDFDFLTDALTRRFSPEGRESQYSLELMNHICRPDEDVTSYGHTVRRLANRAYPGQILDEQILVDLYIKGLPKPDMKRHVYLAKPKTLAQAINCAVTYDAFDNPMGSNSDTLKKPKTQVSVMAPLQAAVAPTNNGNSANNVELNKLTETIVKMNETVSQLNSTVNRLNNSQKRGQRPAGGNNDHVECFRCHRRGHYARDCPEAVNQRPDGHNRANPNNGPMGNRHLN